MSLFIDVFRDLFDEARDDVHEITRPFRTVPYELWANNFPVDSDTDRSARLRASMASHLARVRNRALAGFAIEAPAVALYNVPALAVVMSAVGFVVMASGYGDYRRATQILEGLERAGAEVYTTAPPSPEA